MRKSATWIGLSATLLLLTSCSGPPGKTAADPGADADGHVAATQTTARLNAAATADLPLDDQAEFEDARRGFLATDDPLVTTTPDGQVVWNRPAYDFIQGDAPPSVNPSLWRQAKLNGINGLFKVTDRVYQVRGYDLSNMSVIEGDSGRILVDPLTTVDTSRKALALVNRQLGERPIVAVILTHSHIDHFGGIKGVISAEDVRSGAVRVIAPKDFLIEAVSENVLAGPVMARRSMYMYGAPLARSARGHVDSGLGKAPASQHHLHPAADRDRRPHRAGDADRRRRLRLSVRPPLRSADRAHLLPAAAAGVLRRRDRLPEHAQPLHAARRQGARCAAVERLHRPGDRPVRRPDRRGLQQPSLAGVGPREGDRLPEEAARHVQVHPRPDAPPGVERHDARRDRRDTGPAEEPAPLVPESRLLRDGQAQRPGGVRLLLRLVRRKSGRSRPAAAARRRASATSRRWAAPLRCRPKRRPPSTAGSTAGRRHCSITWSSPSPATPPPRLCSPARTTSSATRPNRARGETST